ncbi:hypothetical protein PSENEW3_00004340 [Picochlorum sp. SENEW3]|nr:hypothetical protein PSENEW3_00004340 [Picochlorum sp. SENEW3]
MASEQNTSSDTKLGSHYYIDEKWDAALDSTLRKVVYGSLAGGITAMVLFRSGSTRAALTAFGAGFGAGSAYYENQAMVRSKRLYKCPPQGNHSSSSTRRWSILMMMAPCCHKLCNMYRSARPTGHPCTYYNLCWL